MGFVELTRDGEIVHVTLHRGKVNAINGAVVEELGKTLDVLREDASARALVLTGHGKFFSFGLDVPELYPLPRDRCRDFLIAFTELYTSLFVYPKPIVAAVNGHAIAGGCMLAMACDRRLMADGKGKIGLNEITFGASVFAGSVEMLRICAGPRNAERVLIEGSMYPPAEACAMGLVDRIVPEDELMSVALAEARKLASRDAAAFASLKGLLRRPILEVMRARESESVREFVEIWYSESTREQLKGIQIRS
jgi:enoyl-CoA hydratase/carnithine racemase